MKQLKFYNTRMLFRATPHMKAFVRGHVTRIIKNRLNRYDYVSKWQYYSRFKQIVVINLLLNIVCWPVTLVKDLVCDLFEIGELYEGLSDELFTENELLDFVDQIIKEGKKEPDLFDILLG